MRAFDYDSLTGEDGGGPWPALSDLLAATTLIFLVLFAVVALPALRKAGEAEALKSTLRTLESQIHSDSEFVVKPVGDYLRITIGGDVVFPQNRSSLADMNQIGRDKLTSLARVLNDGRTLALIDQIHVVGHTSSEGTDAQNWQLSSDRAVTIAQFLITNGHLPPCKVTALGRGRFYPLEPDSARARAKPNPKDRRIELELRPVVVNDQSQELRRNECVERRGATRAQG